MKRGSGGAEVAKPLENITLLDIYRAVDCVGEGQLFHFHENPNSACPVGRNIHAVLDKRLEEIQAAMEQKMQSITLQDVMEDADKLVQF